MTHAIKSSSDSLSPQADLLEDAREASIKTIAEHLRMVYRLRQAVGDPCAPAPCSPPPCSPPTAPDPAQLAGDILFDLARVQLTAYNGLLTLSSNYADKVVDALRMLLRPAGSAPASTGRVVHLQRTSRHTATGEFTVTNGLRRPAHVSFLVSEFCAVDGGTPFPGPATFHAAPPPPQGDERCLPPCEQRRFVVEVTLVSEFQSGKSYTAKLHVAVAGCASEELLLLVALA